MLNTILKLERPLGVLDFETTGINPKEDRVIQIALTIHYPHRKEISWASYINPERPITNTDNHNITDEMVRVAPTFRQIGPALEPKIRHIDWMGYNVHFDLDFLTEEMKRAGVEWKNEGFIIDPMHIYKMRHGHNLTNAYCRYVDPKGFTGAHNAIIDVAATEAVLIGQLQEYTDLPRTVKDLSNFCFPHPENAVDKTGKFVWIENDAAFNFGKWRGRKLNDPEVRGYLSWMANRGDFSDEVKEIASNALSGKFPIKDQ